MKRVLRDLVISFALLTCLGGLNGCSSSPKNEEPNVSRLQALEQENEKISKQYLQSRNDYVELSHKYEELEAKYKEVFSDRDRRSKEVRRLQFQYNTGQSIYEKQMAKKSDSINYLEVESARNETLLRNYTNALYRAGYDLELVAQGQFEEGPTEFERLKAKYEVDKLRWEKDRLALDGRILELRIDSEKKDQELEKLRGYYSLMEDWLVQKGFRKN